VEVDPAHAPVVVPGRVLNELWAHARESHPEECCGLVTGVAGEPLRHVHRCRNDMTLRHRSDPVRFPRDGRAAFYMNEIDYLKAREDAEARGERVTAVYHSHVGAGVYLSEMDQEFAEHELFPFPGAAQIVMAVVDGSVRGTGIFRVEPESGAYAGRCVEAEPL
jgi:proteasome lid subunit RPN8/RPN11